MVDIRLVAPYELPGVKSASFEEAMKYLKRQKVIGFDIETTPDLFISERASALDPYTNKIVTVQLGTDRIVYVFDTRFISVKKFRWILETKKIVKVGANLKFDVKNVIKFNLFPRSLHDVMLWEQIMNNGIKVEKGFYTLAEISKRWNIFDYDNNDIGISKDVRQSFRLDKPLTSQQILYAGFDVYTVVKIYKKQVKYVSKDPIQACIKLENDFILPLAWCEFNGIHINVEKWLDNLEVYKRKLAEQEDRLNAFSKDLGIESINWNSSKQVIPIFKGLGVPVSILDKDKSSQEGEDVYKESVGKAHIQKHAQTHPIVAEYLEYKQLKRLTTAYGTKFLENINPVSGRIHSDYFQILNTGRIASTNPNLQNIPQRREGYREAFDAPNNKVLVVADYSSQEMRVVADFAQEEVMIDFFLNGDGDMHSLTGRRMFGVPVSSKENADKRYIAKVLGFTILYGGSPHKIADVFQVPIKTGAEWIKKYMKAYPALQPYFDFKYNETLKNGFITIDYTTYRRYFPPAYTEYIEAKKIIADYKNSNKDDEIPKSVISKYYSAKGELQRRSQNYPIQGTSGSITKTAAIFFTNWIIKSGYKNGQVKLVNMVHDEIVVECDATLQDIVRQNLELVMTDAGKQFLKRVPLPASAKISNHWEH